MGRPEESVSSAVAFLIVLIVAGKTLVANIEFGLGILSFIKGWFIEREILRLRRERLGLLNDRRALRNQIDNTDGLQALKVSAGETRDP